MVTLYPINPNQELRLSHKHEQDSSTNLGLAFALNLGFAIFELIGGLLTNSVAVLSDALHDLGDSVSLGSAWLLNRYAERSADTKFSYGYRRFSLLGAVINSLILVGGSGYVLVKAFGRLQKPEAFNEYGLIGIAIVGILINGFAALRLRKGGSLATNMLSWHLIEDVLGWFAILLMGIVSLFADLPVLDPLLSIGISLFVIVNALRNLWAAARVFLQAVPQEINLPEIETALSAVHGIEAVHDLRVWSLDGEQHVLSAHLIIKPETNSEAVQRIKRECQAALAPLPLEDTTLQLDFGEADHQNETSKTSHTKDDNSQHDH